MPTCRVVVETPVSRTTRARQLEAMFDVPASEKAHLEWEVAAPLDERDWNVGLIVGPSGSGKTSIAREMFGADKLDESRFAWGGASVIDDFEAALGIEAITGTCQAVGFNTVPAWLRPYAVLSNGEKFRVRLARMLLEDGDPIVHDEFTSVVDRQVAKIGSHAVAKYVRRNGRRFVAVSCHDDIIEWLQPDWVLRPETQSFDWRSVQRRPKIDITVAAVPYDTWRVFAPFHYLTAKLRQGAACFGLFVHDGDSTKIAAFCGMLFRPHASVKRTSHPIVGISRMVTLPDFQGLGLAYRLMDVVAGAYRAFGCRVRAYPAHPPFVRSFVKSPSWIITSLPGDSLDKSAFGAIREKRLGWNPGGRPNAIAEFVGQALPREDAERLLSPWPDGFWHHYDPPPWPEDTKGAES